MSTRFPNLLAWLGPIMRIRRGWNNLGIRPRLFLITLLPMAYLFVSLMGYTWRSHLLEIDQELAERGRIVSTALAQGMEYNVGVRNFSALKLALHALVQTDSSLYRIDILDANRRELVRDVSGLPIEPEHRAFETPIKKQLMWVNLLSGSGQGSDKTAPRYDGKSQEVIGYVRVRMSPTTMLVKQHSRFSVELTMAALALLVSSWLVFYLSQSLTRPLYDAVDALLDIRRGRYFTRVALSAGGEIGELQASINDMAHSLEEATRDLENKVAARTQDLIASRNDALKADAEKRRLIQKVHTIVEDERKSIAIEIHDELNAALVGARLELERIAQLAGQLPESASRSEIDTRARAVIRLTRELYANGRNLVRRLRPEILEMLGLPGAIDDIVRHYNSSAGSKTMPGESGAAARANLGSADDAPDRALPDGCHFDLEYDGDFANLRHDLAISAYRIIQEALSNILKHAKASQATIWLEADHDLQQLRIRISDDGVGFVPDQSFSGIGLTGMRERVAGLNGILRVSSAPMRGTQIDITLPLTGGDASDA